MQKPTSIATENKIINRKHTSSELRRSHVNRWKKSNLTMSEYCRQQNLPVSNLSNWSRKNDKSKHEFKKMTVSASPVVQERQANVIEIMIDQRIKMRLLNVTDLSLVAHIVKDIIKCN